MDKIGVLISVYSKDSPDLFRRAIQSIVAQDLRCPAKVKIYLGVDGPVSAAMRATILSFEPSLHKVVWFPENRGLASVLNDLIAAREDEEFFFRMDADDRSMPDRFSRQVTFMQDHPSVDILGTAITEVNQATLERRMVHYPLTHERAMRTIAYRSPVAHPTVCFRARVFDRVPQYPIAPYNEDIHMWFRCMDAGLRFANLEEPLYEFRVDNAFWSRRGAKKSWGEFTAYVQGIWKTTPVTWRYIFPAMRLLLRLGPSWIQKSVYDSPLRRYGTKMRQMDGSL